MLLSCETFIKDRYHNRIQTKSEGVNFMEVIVGGVVLLLIIYMFSSKKKRVDIKDIGYPISKN